MGRGQQDNHRQNGSILLRILVRTVWNFVQAKYNPWFWTGKCGGLIWSCFTRNPQKKGIKKRNNNVFLQVDVTEDMTLQNVKQETQSH